MRSAGKRSRHVKIKHYFVAGKVSASPAIWRFRCPDKHNIFSTRYSCASMKYLHNRVLDKASITPTSLVSIELIVFIFVLVELYIWFPFLVSDAYQSYCVYLRS